MFFKVISLCFLVSVSNADTTAQDRVIARIGEEKITYGEVISKLVQMLSMQGISMQQFIENRKPEELDQIIKKLRDLLIDQKALSIIASRKKYQNNPAYQEKINQTIKSASIQFYHEEKTKEVENDNSKIQAKIMEIKSRLPETKQFSGRIIVVNKKSDADGIIKALNIRDKSKSIDSAFIDLGKKYSITDYQENKGYFSLNENEIMREYGKSSVDSLKSTKENTVSSVVEFKSSSKFNGKYGVFYVQKTSIAPKPSEEQIKPHAIKEIVADVLKKEIDKEKKSIEIKTYGKDGLLETEESEKAKS